MKRNDHDETAKPIAESVSKTTIKTGVSSYSFSPSWLENQALKDILVGMIADDYHKPE
jgi:hypothetical protein